MMWAVWCQSDFSSGYLGPGWFPDSGVVTLWLGRNHRTAGFFSRDAARAAVRASTVRQYFRVTLVPVEVHLIARSGKVPKRGRQGRKVKVSP